MGTLYFMEKMTRQPRNMWKNQWLNLTLIYSLNVKITLCVKNVIFTLHCVEKLLKEPLTLWKKSQSQIDQL